MEAGPIQNGDIAIRLGKLFDDLIQPEHDASRG
jgi:hypothetical protein